MSYINLKLNHFFTSFIFLCIVLIFSSSYIYAGEGASDRSRDIGIERPLIQKYRCDADPNIIVFTLSSCPDLICWDGVTKSKLFRYCPNNLGNTRYSQVCKKFSYDRSCTEYFFKTEIQHLKSTIDFHVLMSDLMKDYKHLSTNFLEDNNSISSIPRNFASLQTRHINWMSQLENVLIQNRININSIIDSSSYQRNILLIKAISLNLFPNDFGLSNTEKIFNADLLRIHKELNITKIRLDELLHGPLMEHTIRFTGINAAKLEDDLVNLSENIEKNIKQLNSIRQSILAQQRVRQEMKKSSVELWLDTADKAFKIYNLEESKTVITSSVGI